MNLLKKFFFKKSTVAKPVLDDATYYEDLFIKNKRWNTAEPNEEELQRWLIIERFLQYVFNLNYHGASHILDLGCGRGWLTNKLSAFGNAMGIEPVRSVVEYGKTLFPKLQLLHGTSADLLAKGARATFDIVVSSEVIEHIPNNDKQNFVEDINLLLKPNGFAIITTPRKDIQDEWLKYCDPDQPVEDWLTETQLEELFTGAGFKKIFLERFACSPKPSAPELEVYQLWLFQKK